MFQGNPGGPNYKTFGFEYWSDPNDRNAGYVEWQVDGQPSHRVLAAAVAPDQGDGGSGVGQRLIPEEPMAIILNLGMSRELFISLVTKFIANSSSSELANDRLVIYDVPCRVQD